MYTLYAFYAGLFTFFITTLGSSVVFFFKKINNKVINSIMAFSGGIMISAAFFSLLLPGIELSYLLNIKPYLICSIGIICGTLLLFFGDIFFSKKVNQKKIGKSSLMLLLSITLHNIPEGLSLGVAFGSIIYGIKGASLTSAIILTIGIALQNFPEGCAVSLPLLGDNFSKKKSFLYGSMSALVEPISAIIGSVLVLRVRLLLPFLLSFAAGAMLFVVVKEIIPGSFDKDNNSFYSLIFMISFILMMILDLYFS